jgi:hypothetical protein
MENENLLMSADNFSLSELGIEKRGEFDFNGGLSGWEITDYLADGLPRWLLKQSVIELTDNGDVYVRGMYSEILSRERRLMWSKFHSNKKIR